MPMQWIRCDAMSPAFIPNKVWSCIDKRCWTGTVATIGLRITPNDMQCNKMQCHKINVIFKNRNPTHSIITREQAMLIYKERCTNSLFDITNISHDWRTESHVCLVSTNFLLIYQITKELLQIRSYSKIQYLYFNTSPQGLWEITPIIPCNP